MFPEVGIKLRRLAQAMLRPLAGLASGRRGRRLLTVLAAALLLLGVLPLLLWKPGGEHHRESLEAEQHLEAPPSKAFCAKVGITCLWYQAHMPVGSGQRGAESRDMLGAAVRLSLHTLCTAAASQYLCMQHREQILLLPPFVSTHHAFTSP